MYKYSTIQWNLDRQSARLDGKVLCTFFHYSSGSLFFFRDVFLMDLAKNWSRFCILCKKCCNIVPKSSQQKHRSPYLGNCIKFRHASGRSFCIHLIVSVAWKCSLLHVIINLLYSSPWETELLYSHRFLKNSVPPWTS